MPEYRVGTGFDAHALVEGVPLVLGGIRVPFAKGLAGHSDGDVLAHALTDAVLGAAGLADIGAMFPSGDERWRGSSSLDLLSIAWGSVREARLGARERGLRARRRGAPARTAPARDARGARGRAGRRPRARGRTGDDDRRPRLHGSRRGPRRAGGRAAPSLVPAEDRLQAGVALVAREHRRGRDDVALDVRLERRPVGARREARVGASSASTEKRTARETREPNPLVRASSGPLYTGDLPRSFVPTIGGCSPSSGRLRARRRPQPSQRAVGSAPSAKANASSSQRMPVRSSSTTASSRAAIGGSDQASGGETFAPRPAERSGRPPEVGERRARQAELHRDERRERLGLGGGSNHSDMSSGIGSKALVLERANYAGRAATAPSTTTSPSRSSERSASSSRSASDRGPSATRRSVRARRWRNDPSSGPCFRAGSKRGPRDGQPSASGHSPQRGIRARQTVAPRSKSAWSDARREGRTGAVEDPAHVRVDREDVLAEGLVADRVGRVATDARQLREVVRPAGRGDDAGRAVQIERAAVVSEPCQARMTSAGEAAASDSMSGHRSIQASQRGTTRATWVCWSMTSETRIAYGSRVFRHGRSRAFRLGTRPTRLAELPRLHGREPTCRGRVGGTLSVAGAPRLRSPERVRRRARRPPGGGDREGRAARCPHCPRDANAAAVPTARRFRRT